MPVHLVEISEDALDPGRFLGSVQDPSCGASVMMTGQVRDHHEGRAVEHLEYEAYTEMAAETLDGIAAETVERWPQVHLSAAHRTGALGLGEVSVVVAISSPHRGEAFDACRWCIDALKERLPIWKREYGPDGSRWQEGSPLADAAGEDE